MTGGRPLDLAGVPASVQTRDPALLAAITAFLGDCPEAARPAEVDVREAPAPVPAEQPDAAHGPLRLWRRGASLFLAHGSVLTAEVDDRAVRLERTGGREGELARAVRHVLPTALAHLLGAHGRVVLHAGAVLGPDGGAVVIVGPSGAGKSTLVYAARQHGRPVVADDLVVAALRSNRLEVTGIPRPLAVATAPGEESPSGSRRLDHDARGRFEVALDPAPGWHPATALVVVGHSDVPAGEVRGLEGPSAWDLVAASCPGIGEPERLRRGLSVLAALSRLPGWRLHHGSDPATRLAVANRLLDGIGPDRVRSAAVQEPHQGRLG